MPKFTGVIELQFDLDSWDHEEATAAMELIADEVTRRLRDTAHTLTEPEVTHQEINVSAAMDLGAQL